MIRVEDAGAGVHVVTLDDGAVNVFDLPGLSELTAQVRAHTDQALVLTGAGRAFCAGVDLRPVLERGRDYVARFLPALDDAFLAVFDHPRPVVAAINGHALAGGAVLALAADRRLMAGGTIGVTELAVGVPYPAAAFEIVSAAAGHRAAELILGAGRYDPGQAAAIGIVDRVVPPADLPEAALAEARRLAAVPVETFARTKRQLRAGIREKIERQRLVDGDTMIDAWSSPPVTAAIRNYLEALARRS